MRTYTQIIDAIEVRVRDETNTNFATTELDEEVKDSLIAVSEIFPHERPETYTIESRTGTATSTSSGNLVDATKSQFLSGDVGKIIYNSTKKTWAEIVTFTSSTTVAISKDIMTSGDQYEMYNDECTSRFQINISDIGDYIDIISVEYPKGIRRKWNVIGSILTIAINRVDDSKALTGTQPFTEVYIWFKIKHKVSQLTDFAGLVDLVAGYSEGDTSMVIDDLQSAGTIEADQEFTIANTRGIYRVTADATIASNEATVSFYPGLESDVDNDVVVTFTQSTLTDPKVETFVINYASALAAIREPMLLYQQANAAITTVGLATTRITAIGAEIILAVADVASGRAETVLAVALLSTASTQFDLMNAQIDLGVTALAEGEPLVNTVTVAGGATEFMAQANSNFGAAQGFGVTGRSFLEEARANLNNNSAYLAGVVGEVNAITAMVREAQVNLQEVSSELQIASSGRIMETWGRTELERVKAQMERAVPHSVSRIYSRS